jgi:hypothetical protein
MEIANTIIIIERIKYKIAFGITVPMLAIKKRRTSNGSTTFYIVKPVCEIGSQRNFK